MIGPSPVIFCHCLNSPGLSFSFGTTGSSLLGFLFAICTGRFFTFRFTVPQPKSFHLSNSWCKSTLLVLRAFQETEWCLSGFNGTKVGTLRAFQEPKQHLCGLNGTKVRTLRAFQEPEQHLCGLNGTKVGTLREFQEPEQHLCGLNGTKVGTLRPFQEPEQCLSGLNGTKVRT